MRTRSRCSGAHKREDAMRSSSGVVRGPSVDGLRAELVEAERGADGCRRRTYGLYDSSRHLVVVCVSQAFVKQRFVDATPAVRGGNGGASQDDGAFRVVVDGYARANSGLFRGQEREVASCTRAASCKEEAVAHEIDGDHWQPKG